VLVTNFRVKHILYRVVLAGYQLLDTGRLHPLRERSIRALKSSVDYLEQNMQDALGFDTQKDLLAFSLAQAPASGHYLEFGVYTGGTIRFIASRKHGQTIHGFDSFEGTPEQWSGFTLDRGSFARDGRLPDVPANVSLHKGWFKDTLPAWRESHPGAIAFAHVDCNIFSSTVDVLEGIRERLQPGTVIVFDEYFNYPGWELHEFKAWQEFVKVHCIQYTYIGYARQQAAVKITEIGKTAGVRL
jgi:Macrocin-O-methyltransferase (TylF)